MRKYSDITSRYLKEHKKRTILTILGIIVSITMFSAIATIYYSSINGRIQQVKDQFGNYEAKFIDLNKDKLEVIKNNAQISYGGTEADLGEFSFKLNSNAENKKLLNVIAYDKEAFDSVFKVKLVNGRYPKAKDEIIVENRLYKLLKEKNDNLSVIVNITTQDGKILEEVKKYTVVGAYENERIMKNDSYSAISYLDKLEQGESYNYYSTLKDKKSKISVGREVAKDSDCKVEFNNDLLYLYGQGEISMRNDALIKMFITIVTFVVVCTVVVIYNAFNISVAERIKHFGILRSIGATKKQIRRLVFKEAAFMSIISIPIGIIAGYLGIYITFLVIGDIEEIMGGKPTLYPQVIISTIVLGIITVFISVLIPAIKASKVSPIEAVRGTATVKREKLKRRRAVLTKLLFKFEGQVAYKNIRRSPKKFWITIASLMVSIIMFIFFSNFISYIKITTGEIYKATVFDSMFSKKGAEGFNDSFVDEIKSYDGVGEVFKMNLTPATIPVDKDRIDNNYWNKTGQKDQLTHYKEKALVSSAIISYDENAFKYVKDKLKAGNPTYNDLKNGVIVINTSKGVSSKGKITYSDLTNYKVGDKIKLPDINIDKLNGDKLQEAKILVDKDKYTDFTVVGVVEEEPVFHETLVNSVMFILSNENYSKLLSTKDYNNIALKFTNKEASENLFDKFSAKAESLNSEYSDLFKQMDKTRNLLFQISVLIYGFITLISLIGIVNIVNIITINLLVRKREFAIFKAIGMTKKQFRKLVLLEGTLYGILASILGVIVSYGLVKWLMAPMNNVIDVAYKQDPWSYILGILGVITITFLAALIPLRRLNDMNIMESLRLEE
ncbi:ABC transporter permease [Clostridium sp. YIM B02505]|uniref:ABC transporter permease n=1 Tax=Clostridium yunnanense TaxID=2800325 RepID=A0ABS1EK06_9CLOT|nr:FtsX-like permease family protein [Clostridium yunnanense]MBK1809692.1 ABC transporter permease [Clostridium yunnanense]